VSLEQRGTQTIATKYPVDGAGVITSLTRTDGLVELGEDRLNVEPGDSVPFIDYRQLT
jgi:molybdopterin molybdotransferase